MKYLLILIAILLNGRAQAFVSGPSTVNPGENLILLGTQLERGKIEPNENKNSYQDAEIDLYKLKYARGIDAFSMLDFIVFSLEYGQFKSIEEVVGSDLFYKEDKGSYATLGFSADILHEVDRKFGFYIHVSPFRDYNEKKFSNPRLDLFSIGVTSAFNITDKLFQKSLIHFGSGDGSDQNSYLALDIGFGYRLNEFFGKPFAVSASLFLEADAKQRKDASYDAAFSPAGTEDRIRAFKYGTLVGFDLAITDNQTINFYYLQKLAGYDARSTEIYTLSLGHKF